tara:strand:+ start:1027 stop:3276 length:2250 start_codon:yes stop_codon:yes gene_type:complete
MEHGSRIQYVYQEFRALVSDKVLNDNVSFRTYFDLFMDGYETFYKGQPIQDQDMFSDAYKKLRDMLDSDSDRHGDLMNLDELYNHTRKSKSPPPKKKKLSKEERDENKEQKAVVLFQRKAEKEGLDISGDISLRRADLSIDQLRETYASAMLPRVELVDDSVILRHLQSHEYFPTIQKLFQCKHTIGCFNDEFWHVCNILAKDWALISGANFVQRPLSYRPSEFFNTTLDEELHTEEITTKIMKKKETSRNTKARVNAWLENHDEYRGYNLSSLIKAHLVKDDLALLLIAKEIYKRTGKNDDEQIELAIKNSNLSAYDFNTLDFANYLEILAIFDEADDEIKSHVQSAMYRVINAQVGFLCFNSKASNYWEVVDISYTKRNKRKRNAPDLSESNVCLDLSYSGIDNVLLHTSEIDDGSCHQDEHLSDPWKVPPHLRYGVLYLMYRYQKPNQRGPQCPTCRSTMKFCIAHGLKNKNIEEFWTDDLMDCDDISTMKSVSSSIFCSCDQYFKSPQANCSHKLPNFEFLCRVVNQMHVKYSDGITPRDTRAKCDELYGIVEREITKFEDGPKEKVPLLKCAYQYIAFMYDYAVSHNLEKMRDKIKKNVPEERLFYCINCNTHISHDCVVSDTNEQVLDGDDDFELEQKIATPLEIIAHRQQVSLDPSLDGYVEFQVRWETKDEAKLTWETAASLEKWHPFHVYVNLHQIPVKIFSTDLDSHGTDRRSFVNTFKTFFADYLELDVNLPILQLEN